MDRQRTVSELSHNKSSLLPGRDGRSVPTNAHDERPRRTPTTNAHDERQRRTPTGGSMRALLLPFQPRFIVYTASIALTVLLTALALSQFYLVPYLSVFIAIFGGLSMLGTLDLLQRRHAVLRNY